MGLVYEKETDRIQKTQVEILRKGLDACIIVDPWIRIGCCELVFYCLGLGPFSTGVPFASILDAYWISGLPIDANSTWVGCLGHYRRPLVVPSRCLYLWRTPIVHTRCCSKSVIKSLPPHPDSWIIYLTGRYTDIHGSSNDCFDFGVSIHNLQVKKEKIRHSILDNFR